MGACSGKAGDRGVDAEVLEVGEDPAPRVVILGACGLREAEVFPGT
eukprot:CAMPEP_0168428376 /NCGR_PEP_ID=MMETSP0228-20121227/36827_1 /TAXON_ID=133427 /ORGANISM="Protoceratium reticulatum, Strain CCCM 535 (=CCMP 1889)" /LENGTH=45 /DNA_ID= /DNA_START= /DNA_END= /DNA_ORIENTATION=